MTSKFVSVYDNNVHSHCKVQQRYVLSSNESCMFRQHSVIIRPVTNIHRKKADKRSTCEMPTDTELSTLSHHTISAFWQNLIPHFLPIPWSHDSRIYSDVKVPITSVTKISLHQIHFSSSAAGPNQCVS